MFMLDVSVTYNRFKFLGHQYLTWLWHIIDTGMYRDFFDTKEKIILTVGNRIVLENRRFKDIETVTISGDLADLTEGKVALKKGALVSEMNIKIEKDGQPWALTLKGESLSFVNLKTPVVGQSQIPEDLDGAVLEKIYLFETAIQIMDTVYRSFIKQRLGNDWEGKITGRIKKWIASP
jgi:hypothetical protein